MAEELENEETIDDESTDNEGAIDLDSLDDEEFEKALLSGALPDDGEDELDDSDSEADDNEEEDEETEQPDDKPDDEADDEDSDDNSEDDEESEEEEEDSEEEDNDSDEESDSEAEDNPSDTQDEKLVYKANGQEFGFTKDEVIEKFGEVFGKAMNYTQKMQEIAPYRSMIAAIKEQNLTQDDLNLMIDVLKGDKLALSTVLKRTGVDALDLDEEEADNYQPNNYGRDETELAIEEVISNIQRDPEYPITQKVLFEQWDDVSRAAFANNPVLIEQLHYDIKNGVYDKVNPIAIKLKVLDGGRKPDIEYYKEAGREYYMSQQKNTAAAPKTGNVGSTLEELKRKEAELARREAELAKKEKAKADAAKRASKKKAAAKRKAAAPTAGRSAKPDVLDYLETDAMSDEEFEKFMSRKIK